MIGNYLVNEQYILETSHRLITSPYEHEMTVNFINPASAVEVNQNGILVQLLRSNQMQSWFGRWGSERVKDPSYGLLTKFVKLTRLKKFNVLSPNTLLGCMIYTILRD